MRRTVFENFVINATLRHGEIHDKLTEQYDCNIPWAILMDPTSACNLHCTGCWAAEYGNKMNLTYEELDGIINQANELGCYFFLYTGGEPLVRKEDLIRLCEAHPDSQFSAFTNATLIDGAFADEMLQVKNFIPAISAEGFEESTDSRRGQGTYRKIMQARRRSCPSASPPAIPAQMYMMWAARNTLTRWWNGAPSSAGSLLICPLGKRRYRS